MFKLPFRLYTQDWVPWRIHPLNIFLEKRPFPCFSFHIFSSQLYKTQMTSRKVLNIALFLIKEEIWNWASQMEGENKRQGGFVFLPEVLPWAKQEIKIPGLCTQLLFQLPSLPVSLNWEILSIVGIVGKQTYAIYWEFQEAICTKKFLDSGNIKTMVSVSKHSHDNFYRNLKGKLCSKFILLFFFCSVHCESILKS